MIPLKIYQEIINNNLKMIHLVINKEIKDLEINRDLILLEISQN